MTLVKKKFLWVLFICLFCNRTCLYSSLELTPNKSAVYDVLKEKTIKECHYPRLYILWYFLTHGQLRHCLFYLFLQTVSLINHFLMTLEDIFIPEINNTSLDNVIFILGHPRSGTTNLQKSLLQHPDCVSSDMFDLVFSSLLLKKMMKLNIMQPIKNYFNALMLDYNTKNHAFNINEEMEEHQWLLHNKITYELGLIFPTLFRDCPELFEDIKNITNSDIEFIKACLQRVLYHQNTKGKMYIAKPLTFTSNITAFKKYFPQSKIILCLRNPVDSFSSYINLISVILKIDKGDPFLNTIIQIFYNSLCKPIYKEMLYMVTIKSDCLLFSIDFEQLITQPKEILKEVQLYLKLSVLDLTLIRSESHKKRKNIDNWISKNIIEDDIHYTYQEITKRHKQNWVSRICGSRS